MNQINQEKLAYDTAQKVGERVERMCAEEGWKEILIPMIQKKRDAAQKLINDLGTSKRYADYNRGLLDAYDLIIGYEMEKREQSLKIMRKSTRAKMGG